MLKRFATIFFLLVMVFQSSGAVAADLSAAFSSLIGSGAPMTVSKPGVFTTSTRTVFVGGGIDMRAGRESSSVSLLSITPPSYSAGCGGISAHFGGFSFISGAQIEKLIKTIGQNAVGVVVKLVIKTLCPICDAVIAEMTHLAQQAAKLSVNSCEIATSLATNLMKTVGPTTGPETKVNLCGQYTTANNSASDQLGAIQGNDTICSQAEGWMTKLAESLHPVDPNAPVDSAKAAAIKEIKKSMFPGNVTWNAMNAVYGEMSAATLGTDKGKEEFRNRMLLMNLIGSSVVAPKDPVLNIATDADFTMLPQVSAKQVFDLFMCGAPMTYTAAPDGSMNYDGQGRARGAQDYCKMFELDANAQRDGRNMGGQSAGAAYQLYECKEEDIAKCLKPEKVALKDSTLLKGPGFLFQTEVILYDAVKAVTTNRSGGFSDDFMRIVNAVNFPLYQAVNAAAVYPASTNALMSTMTMLVAETMVGAKLEQLLSPEGKDVGLADIDREYAQRIYAAFEAFGRVVTLQRESYGRMMALQDQAVASIRQINIALQKQVLSPELMGNNHYSAAVADSIKK